MMERDIVLHRSCFSKAEKASDTQLDISMCSLTRKLQIDTVKRVPVTRLRRKLVFWHGKANVHVLHDVAMR